MPDSNTSLRLSRLLGLAGYLALRCGITTGQQIADDFRISIRTVYRDIDDLRAIGLPIAGGAGTGYVLKHSQFVEWIVGQTLRNPRARTRQDERMITEAMERDAA